MVECGERVFRTQARAAAMGDDQRPLRLLLKQRVGRCGAREQEQRADDRRNGDQGSSEDFQDRGQPSALAAFFFAMISCEYFFR